jgi:hypothetical protein
MSFDIAFTMDTTIHYADDWDFFELWTTVSYRIAAAIGVCIAGK